MSGSEPSRLQQDAPETTPHLEDYDLVVRPVGAWVIGGFLLFSILTMWGLVSYIFAYRS
ncbi:MULTISPECIES: hypothetical protein [Acidiphilium]|uniref:Uncharacterized protein n=1 Tax=Acidiphilium rubrum TaxID=526 RepID=A0A8G2CP20_ACIRU|nr:MULTISPECIES: hypothetical protein [Acidiphilium]MCW8308721.1 hypothetical protein [Acidiphilium sp. PA]SIR54227.1 hypothetical protein SAMN05421828_15010 [Acidiphilium rubrum]